MSAVSLSKTNRSAFVQNLPTTAVVVKTAYPKIHKPEVVEEIIVPATGDSQLVEWLMRCGDNAEVLALQRKVGSQRRMEYEDDIKSGRMPAITAEILVLNYDNDTVILADGRTRLTAAARTKWSGVLNIKVREAGCKDDAIAFISRLDSALAKRTKNEMIGYYFGNDVTLSKKHVGLVNSAIQHIRWGCPGGDLANIKECNPDFPRHTVFSHRQLVFTRDNHMQDIQWFQTHFAIGDKHNLLAVGVVTAIILTKMIDGPEVADIWKRFVSGESLTGALLDFREELKDMKVRPAGQAGQALLFRKAMHAYLSEKKLFNAHLSKYSEGQVWQISHGKISSGSPEHDRKGKKQKR